MMNNISINDLKIYKNIFLNMIIDWKDFGIRVSKLGRLCFDDICEKIIKSNSNDDLLKYINDDDDHKRYINGKLYITENAAMIIIISANNKSSTNFSADYLYDVVDNNIDDYKVTKQEYFNYCDNSFVYFEFNDVKWFKAKDICLFLKYMDTKRSVNRLVSKNNKMSLKNLKLINNNILFVQKTFVDAQTIFINQNGLVEILLKSNKPNAIDLAKYFGINVNQKVTRKEIDIVRELDLFCKFANIESKHLYTVNKNSKNRYIIDYYLPKYKIAIEIDEFDHKDRNAKYETKREQFLKKRLKCKFIRCNPDDPDFSIMEIIGKIHSVILRK